MLGGVAEVVSSHPRWAIKIFLAFSGIVDLLYLSIYIYIYIYIYKHAPVFFCRTGICQTQDIFLREIGTKTIYTFLTLV